MCQCVTLAFFSLLYVALPGGGLLRGFAMRIDQKGKVAKKEMDDEVSLTSNTVAAPAGRIRLVHYPQL